MERRYPLAPDGREERVGYHLADPYFRFWFRYVAGNRSRLERYRVQEVLGEILTGMSNTMGWAFVQCCRRWASRYADEEHIGGARRIGSWWSRNGQTEIDVVGVAGQNCVLVGECTWRRTADVDVLDGLRRKQAVLGGKAVAAKPVIFARDGFTPELRGRAKAENVLLVTAADLFG